MGANLSGYDDVKNKSKSNSKSKSKSKSKNKSSSGELAREDYSDDVFDEYKVDPYNIEKWYPKTYRFFKTNNPEMSDNQKAQDINQMIGNLGGSMEKLPQNNGTIISEVVQAKYKSPEQKKELEKLKEVEYREYIDRYLVKTKQTALKRKGQKKNKKKKKNKNKNKNKKTMRR